MKRLLLIATVAFSLAGCATTQNTWDAITGSSVSPQAVSVAANTFDALEATATNYLRLPKCNGSTSICRDPKVTAKLIPAVRSGRVARVNLEQFLRDNPGKLGPVGLYNALQSAINTLNQIVAQYNIGATK